MKFLTLLNEKIRPFTVSMFMQAFFSTFAVCNIGGLSVGNILPLLIFVLLTIGLHYQGKIERRNLQPTGFDVVTAGLGCLFTGFYIASEHKGLTGGFDNRMFRLGFLLATTLGLFFLFFKSVRILMICISHIQMRKTAVQLGRKKRH